MSVFRIPFWKIKAVAKTCYEKRRRPEWFVHFLRQAAKSGMPRAIPASDTFSGFALRISAETYRPMSFSGMSRMSLGLHEWASWQPAGHQRIAGCHCGPAGVCPEDVGCSQTGDADRQRPRSSMPQNATTSSRGEACRHWKRTMLKYGATSAGTSGHDPSGACAGDKAWPTAREQACSRMHVDHPVPGRQGQHTVLNRLHHRAEKAVM